MKQHYMIIDVALCFDCNDCFMACKDEHIGNNWAPYTDEQPRHGHRWMNILRTERGKAPRMDIHFLPMPCQHCENAPCIKASNGAITRREDGIVMIDMIKAKGNEALVKSCPYGAIYWSEEAATPQKCTFCAHILDHDPVLTMPRCAHSCPTNAIVHYLLEPEEMEAKIKEEALEVFRPELGTNPHVFYKNLYMYTKNFISAEVLVNGECFEGANVTLSGASAASATTDYFGEFKFDDLADGDYTLKVTSENLEYSTDFTIDGKSLNLGEIILR
ncbi:4Fe-4S dicluster domain-containing protein [Parasporobacterium paucivorans]|uniref:Fe-S-cluster-containing dehydrogenase component n=1 Tax=Parasporobacterium paucivorans DSM 15970 TaxID=1122934 RepID=A0A1M6FDA0_9FIRM|nr:4Fe-4S dicluster domain-containing protein [Parasporobacterium paucivorans]SHI95623.1 Fe-S-cluster-containing dehydrogenase component [Parasporobacterium paucivorans DSM 15970]